MRKLLLIVTVALALLAAACGDDAETDVGSPEPDPDPASGDAGTDDPEPDDPEPDPSPDPPLGAGPYPIADLTITVTLADGADANTYRLACLGDTATLTGDNPFGNAAAMCLALNEVPVRDRLVNGEPTDGACTQQYGGPEVATITGSLDGQDVDTSFDRSDGCGISDWTLFTTMLPPPA